MYICSDKLAENLSTARSRSRARAHDNASRAINRIKKVAKRERERVESKVAGVVEKERENKEINYQKHNTKVDEAVVIKNTASALKMLILMRGICSIKEPSN